MSAAELMFKLHSAGIKLQVCGNKLRYSPRWAVSAALRLELAQRKKEILSFLSSDLPQQQELDRNIRGLECQRCFHCSGTGQCFRQCCGLPRVRFPPTVPVQSLSRPRILALSLRPLTNPSKELLSIAERIDHIVLFAWKQLGNLSLPGKCYGDNTLSKCEQKV